MQHMKYDQETEVSQVILAVPALVLLCHYTYHSLQSTFYNSDPVQRTLYGLKHRAKVWVTVARIIALVCFICCIMVVLYMT